MKTLLALAAVLFLSAAPACAEENAALSAFLGGIRGAEAGVVTPVADAALSRLFPAHDFYALYFRQFPLARETPAPLQSTNIFALPPDGRVVHLGDAAQLLEFFKEGLPLVEGEDQARDVVTAWLLLVKELHQDGFYKFSAPESVTVTLTEGEMTATGHVKIGSGGEGQIAAEADFTGAGGLADIRTKAEIQGGIRPICQATLLLDKNPLVRRMAEQDIVVMGSAAKPYLDGQRAKAAPALQKEIDRVWARIVKEKR